MAKVSGAAPSGSRLVFHHEDIAEVSMSDLSVLKTPPHFCAAAPHLVSEVLSSCRLGFSNWKPAFWDSTKFFHPVLIPSTEIQEVLFSLMATFTYFAA